MSYNIYRHNKKLKQLFDFLQNSKADIICLQECPKLFLNKLQEINPNKYYIEYSNEYFIKSKKPNSKNKSVHLYNVILSKYKPQKVNKIPHIQHEKFPIYYRWINKYNKIDIKTIYIDIEIENKEKKTKENYRIFNSHLECVASPNFRINQFKNLIIHKSESKKNIFVGDYNVFSNNIFLSVLIGPFSGYKPKDYILNEKKQFQKLFETLGLKNIFHKKRTFSTLPFQTDFIVIDKNIHYKKPQVLKKEKNGSDHFPIEVELE